MPLLINNRRFQRNNCSALTTVIILYVLNGNTQLQLLTLASSIPEMDASGRSSTRKAARLAVYEATMIIAKPAQTMPSTRALKLRGVPARQQYIIYSAHLHLHARAHLCVHKHVHLCVGVHVHVYLQFYIMYTVHYVTRTVHIQYV